ncbi:hypothetical protein CFBP6626_00355 [Agrobacterium tumefaciens]|nr:hypothetical protein CFBP6626_00355 [Agrobacterium tumefaciens]CUX41108.1 conserved hypothetical protein [Agrobacterium genomosp. 5 str. CFBP 6626]
MKHNLKTADSASVIERLFRLASEFDMLTGDTHDAHTAAEIACDAFQGVLSGTKATEVVKAEWAELFYYIGDTERRHIDYKVVDAVRRAREADERATELSDRLMDVVREMREDVPAPASTSSSGLETVIQNWIAAHAAWVATEKDGAIPDGTPEELAERQALLELAGFPCISLEDVRRKANLFQNRSYLSGMAADCALDLLRSFSGEKYN